MQTDDRANTRAVQQAMLDSLDSPASSEFGPNEPISGVMPVSRAAVPTPEAAGAEPVAAPVEYDRIAADIRAAWSRWNQAPIRFEIETGRVLVEHLHGGEADAWRKRRKSSPSLRKIARVLGGLCSAPELYRAGCTFVITHKYPGVVTSQHLKISHSRAVAGLTEDKALELLERADREKQTVRALQESARRERPRGRGGRPAIPRLLRQLREAERALPREGADLRSLARWSSASRAQTRNPVGPSSHRGARYRADPHGRRG
jgi:hypothetical protein